MAIRRVSRRCLVLTSAASHDDASDARRTKWHLSPKE
jgi:hypothetical protein